ncbi:uncharacterized protein [Nicotiana tomentosiformis]|uniref:uncharacterized protein n=1 Tax=Nicotiana tomentosiformis TaxID=4098 RepID=UPI00388CCDB0
MKSFIVKTDERLDAHGSTIKELRTGLRNLEKQVGKISTILSERIPGTLPADTERNPKEMVNVVTLRSGQVLKDPTPIQKEVVPEKESVEQLEDEVDDNKKGKKGIEKNKKQENSRRDESEESEHMPALPFPQKLYREKLDKQFERFMDMLKKVNVNLMLIEVLSQMPAYVKFLKELLKKKRKIEETSVVKLIEHCSVIWQNKLPQKCKDFIVVKMKENKEVPINLGRPFLEIGRAILDIHDRKHILRVGEETVTFEMNVETWVRKEKLAANVEWRVKSSKEKVLVFEKHKCGVYPQKDEKKLSAWMCALVRVRGMDPD